MYSVKITNGSSSKIIHDDRVNIRLSDTKIATTINQASSFAFNLYPNNPGWDLLHEYTTGIEVWKLSKLLFKGRVMSVQTNYTNEGQLLKQVSCESQLAFLNDSIQSYKKVQMKPRDFFVYLINEHNKQVDADRQLKVGNVNVTNSTDNVYCYVEDGLSTFDEIDADLLQNESLGGELWIRNEADGVYIDWLRDGVAKGRQQIKMNKNMLSVYSKPDLNGLCTVLYPFGATPETTATDDKASDVASPRLTIESVNGGKKYLENADLISIYGRISGSKTWDDVKVAANLKTKGQSYLDSFKAFKVGYEVEAVDLEPLGLAVDDFEVGNYYRTVNPLEGLDDYLRIIAMSIDINAPLQSQLTIGDKQITFSQYMLGLKNARSYTQQIQIQQDALADLSGKYDGLVSENDKFKNQMAEMQAKIDALNGRNRNLIIAKDVVSGALSNDGSIIDEVGYITTGFIEVVAGDDYTATTKPDDNYLRLAEYDLNKDFLQLTDNTATIAVGVSTRYVRLTFKAEAYGDPYKFEHGSTATPWSPAPED